MVAMHNVLNIPVTYAQSKGELPFDADARQFAEEFSLALRYKEDGPPSAVNYERDALVESTDAPSFPRVLSLLCWISIIKMFRQEETGELPPFRKELALAFEGFSAFTRAKKTDRRVLPVIPFLLGQVVFRMLCDLFPQSNAKLRAACLEVVESLSVAVHYELCGFYVQKSTVQHFRQRYLLPGVVKNPDLKQVTGRKRFAVDSTDAINPPLAFGKSRNGDALKSRSLNAVLGNTEVSERMQGYLDVITKGSRCYGKKTDNNMLEAKKAKTVIRYDTTMMSDSERDRHHDAIAAKLAAFTLNRTSGFCTTWLSPTTRLLYGQSRDRRIPGKPTYDTIRVSMRVRDAGVSREPSKVARPRPASSPSKRPISPCSMRPNSSCSVRPQSAFKARLGRLESALDPPHVEESPTSSPSRPMSASPNSSPAKSRPPSGFSLRRSPTQLAPRAASPESLSPAARYERSIKAVTEVSWKERMESHDVITGLKKQCVDRARLRKEEDAYLKDIGELVSVKLKCFSGRPMTR